MSVENHPIRVEVGRTAPGAESAQAEQGGDPASPPLSINPLIDIHEGPEGLILEADLPGSTDRDVQIQLEEHVLTLHARVTPPTPSGAKLVHEEYRVGEFSRSFILSDEVERGKIEAELKNGVLRLILPKSERAKTRRIEIKS